MTALQVRPGVRVQLQGSRMDRRHARILRSMMDVDGGVVLDRPLAGLRMWNRRDLLLVPCQEGMVSE